MKYLKNLLLHISMFFFLLVFTSCSNSANKAKSDLEIYQEMNSFNSTTEFTKFSNSFVDLNSNHPSSIYLKDAFLIAINSSIKHKEFQLAKFYLQKMKSKFLNKDNLDFYDFYDLKLSFFMIKDKNRNQKELIEIKKESEVFLKRYKNSDYSYMVSDIASTVSSSLFLINKNASKLYDILENKNSSEIYKNKNKHLSVNLNEDDIAEPKNFFIIELFEQ